jgi:hypothetical protein
VNPSVKEKPVRKICVVHVAVLASLLGGAGQALGDPFLYEPVHNLTTAGPLTVRLSRLPNIGFLNPGQEVAILVTGESGIRVLNDTDFVITGLHWEIPATGDPRIAPGTLVVDEDPIPPGWIQPDVAFGDVNPGGDGQVGDSDIFASRTPRGPGPTNDLWFLDGVIAPGQYFTDDKRYLGTSIPAHYALVSYAGVSVPEPSSLLLWTTAASGLLGYAWLKGRRRGNTDGPG